MKLGQLGSADGSRRSASVAGRHGLRVKLAIVIAAVAVLPAVPGWAAGIGSWQPAGSLPAAPLGPAVTLADGRVLVLELASELEQREFAPHEFEVLSERRYLTSELYDPRSGAWMSGPAPPGEAASTLVALPAGGALLVGETSCGPERRLSRICRPLAATYVLDAHELRWLPAAAMLVPRTRPATARLPDGRILVAGGFGAACTGTVAGGYSCPALPSAEIFDPATGSWSATPPMPGARGGDGAAVLSDGTVLLVGGGAQVLRYDPLANRWTALAPPPEQLTGATLLPLPGDRAIALGSDASASFDGSYGGAGTLALVLCRSIPEIYSVARNAWTPAPPLPGESGYDCATSAAPLAGAQILLDGAVLDAHQRCWAPAAQAPFWRLIVPLLGGEALGVTEGLAQRYVPAPVSCTQAEQLRASLFEAIAPQGEASRAARLRSRPYRFTLRPGRAGTIEVRWHAPAVVFEESGGGAGAGAAVIARGHAQSAGAGPVTITMRLTSAGKQLLANRAADRYPTELPLTAYSTFKAGRAAVVTLVRPFVLGTGAGRP